MNLQNIAIIILALSVLIVVIRLPDLQRQHLSYRCTIKDKPPPTALEGREHPFRIKLGLDILEIGAGDSPVRETEEKKNQEPHCNATPDPKDDSDRFV